MAQVKISGLTAATAALTDLIEMESSGGMSGKITLQQISDLFAASRVGELYVGIHSNAPENVLLFDGSTKARAAYPELWAMIAAGRLPSVTDAVWLTNTDAARLAGAVGAFSTGDGSTTFRLPDWRGVFLRGAGTNSVLAMANTTKYAGGLLAGIIQDAMQGHYHLGGYNTGGNSGTNGWGTYTGSTVSVISGASTAVTYPGLVGPARTDGTNGDPRKAMETRPVSVSLNFGIYFE